MKRLFGFAAVFLISSVVFADPTTQPAVPAPPKEDDVVVVKSSLSDTLVDVDAFLQSIPKNLRDDVSKVPVGGAVRFGRWATSELRGRPIYVVGRYPGTGGATLWGELEVVKAPAGFMAPIFTVSSYADGSLYKLVDWSPGDKVIVFGRVSIVSCIGSGKPTNAMPDPPLSVRISIADAIVGRVVGPQGYKREELEKQEKREKEGNKK